MGSGEQFQTNPVGQNTFASNGKGSTALPRQGLERIWRAHRWGGLSNYPVQNLKQIPLSGTKHNPMEISDLSLEWVGPSHRIAPSLMLFHYYGIGLPLLSLASQRAICSGRSPGEELVRTGALSRQFYGRIIADHLGVQYRPAGPLPHKILPSSLTMAEKPTRSIPDGTYGKVIATYQGIDKRPDVWAAIVPDAQKALVEIARMPHLSKEQINFCDELALNESQHMADQDRHLVNAQEGLHRQAPEFSAKIVFARHQIIALCAIIAGLGMGSAFFTQQLAMVLHGLATLFYASVALLRLVMVAVWKSRPPQATMIGELDKEVGKVGEHNLPFYSVIVALRDEAHQVGPLCRSLGRLDWPADRLQILLVCEADDPATIMACKQAMVGAPNVQAIICPVGQPRTKPKALNFALPLAKGEFIVLYDAEDLPHPKQLKEAYCRFLDDDNLGCLQAPLLIHNDKKSWFSALFAIEYKTLFTSILPGLEKLRSPIPLGGTSNHFKTEVLKKVGSWDSYNVTEDADLGIRLARKGYRSGTICLPTFEEAPEAASVWMRQRTRWLKGWMQTLLVHMRNPIRLARDLGIRQWILFQLIITANVVSCLIHPYFLTSTLYYLADWWQAGPRDHFGIWMFGLDIFNITLGYMSYLALAWLSLENARWKHLRRMLVFVPVYWVMISVAGYRAFVHLLTRPFHWEKTPHGSGRL